MPTDRQKKLAIEIAADDHEDHKDLFVTNPAPSKVRKASWESWLEKTKNPMGLKGNRGYNTRLYEDTETHHVGIHDNKNDDIHEISGTGSNYIDEIGQDTSPAHSTKPKGTILDPVKRSWELWLEKNNAIETSHKEDEKKEEWDGKFSSSTIRDDVKDDDDKAVSEEESLEELTDGKLEEVEKLKSWELWLEKDALDGKGGNEAKDDLMMPSLMGMYKKPTKQTKEGQARDYLRDDHNVESYHSRRLGHGKKYESGKRPLEKNPQSGGFVNEPRKEEWDITADQDAQQRGSGKNTFDDKDDVEPAGGFIQGQGRTIPKTGTSPNIKPQGKGVKHRGRPRGSKNKAWELWLEKDALDGKQGIDGLPKSSIKPILADAQEVIDRDDRGKKNEMYKSWLEKMQGAGDARFGNQHLTGLDQEPVNNEEDEANILPEKEEKTNEKEEKQEETDNKPYKGLKDEKK